MPFIRRTGKPALHYRIDDFTDPWKPAATIVLQHGYARNSTLWYGWAPNLARSNRVVRMDLRGHGESPLEFDPGTQSTLAGYVGDLIALLDTLDAGPVHYCGESFGGILGMVLAAEYPQRVRDPEMLCGLYGLVKHASAQAYLAKIEAPVLGLYPTPAALTSSEQGTLLREGIRDLQMIHLPTSSHAVLTVEPDACARHLLDFVAAHTREV